ncbi:MAG: oligopeptide transporter, OPT family [Kiritimatiellae bacterium]|nr:oligopeptide transporter, OPT family [Kiritimatiellia bacterium]
MSDDGKQRVSARELTFTSVLLGVALAVVFGAANAYLGLRVGLTVSASIPAAVVSMGVFRFLFRKDSILENNMVQTIGSAGESLAAGMIFTMPAVFLWAGEGICAAPGAIPLTLVALSGGVLGALFMLPLRRSIVASDDPELAFPEGTACAAILRAGAKGGAGAGTVFAGFGLAMALQFAVAGLKATASCVAAPLRFLRGELGFDVSAALVGVGYVVGPKIAAALFAGSFLGWMALIPALAQWGGPEVRALYDAGGAAAVWSSHVRYVGAGAIATGGFIALARNLPAFVRAFCAVLRAWRPADAASDARDRDLPGWTIPAGVGGVVLFMAASPAVPCGFGGAALMAAFGFFFAAVSARMVAVVGSSNNPVSGMAIATLVVASLAFKAFGVAGAAGMTAAMFVGAVTCVVAAMAGDMAQDLRTGRLVGATPWKQQVGELIGAVAASLAIGGVLHLLHRAWGFGGAEIPAPQATLMKLVVEGVMGGDLPWRLLATGAALAAAMAALRLPVTSFAIGLYLPIGINGTILLGGLARWLCARGRAAAPDAGASRGTLFAAGLVAGEGTCGLVLACLALAGGSLALPRGLGIWGGVAALALVLGALAFAARTAVPTEDAGR